MLHHLLPVGDRFNFLKLSLDKCPYYQHNKSLKHIVLDCIEVKKWNTIIGHILYWKEVFLGIGKILVVNSPQFCLIYREVNECPYFLVILFIGK